MKFLLVCSILLIIVDYAYFQEYSSSISSINTKGIEKSIKGFHNPCHNNGIFISWGYFEICICLKPFEGRYCEKCKGKDCELKNIELILSDRNNGRADAAASICDSNPCFNNGTCIPTDSNTDFRCDCPRAFNGRLCNKCKGKSCPCDSNPCQYGGTCINSMNATDFTCSCPQGYIGKNCSEIDPCYPDRCNGRDCIPQSIGFTCTCDPITCNPTNCTEDCPISCVTNEVTDYCFGDCSDPDICPAPSICSSIPGVYTCICPVCDACGICPDGTMCLISEAGFYTCMPRSFVRTPPPASLSTKNLHSNRKNNGKTRASTNKLRNAKRHHYRSNN